jgi:DNA phosphorothioation-associated putative methyltransferase
MSPPTDGREQPQDWTKVQRHKTAIKRTGLSRPMQLAVSENLISSTAEVLDYGCGHGTDVRLLSAAGLKCRGWDPIHAPDGDCSPADVVNLGFVVNVIEDASERVTVLRDAWDRTKRLLIVAARLQQDAQKPAWLELNDGYLTKSGTFQKFFEQNELRQWINHSLDVDSVAAAPGVFYVFRDEGDRFSYTASRFTRRTPPRRVKDPFKGAREKLEPLMSFVEARGRLPLNEELYSFTELIEEFGSLKRAFRLIRRASGSEVWDKLIAERAQDMTVHLALTKFGRRPKLSSLTAVVRYDVRAFFGTYTKACSVADRLLFQAGERESIDMSCRDSGIGKKTPTALYVHVSGLDDLAPVLRVYEGCARVLTGQLEGANVVKLHRDKPAVSYLWYPTFDDEAHPALAGAFIVYLDTLEVRYRDYTQAENPPILHRKEEFVPLGHPGRDAFVQLTAAEESCGLYEDTSVIGTRKGWDATLKLKSVAIVGHEIIQVSGD